MRLIVQPRDGLAPLLTAIRGARKEIDLCIFRFDVKAVQQALEDAVRRGVRVRVLIAHTNRRGEKKLRALEQTMLAAGVTVARTGTEFVRYHSKIMVIDRRALWLLGFNFTAIDITRSRSFGIVTGRRLEILQALKLFDADSARQPYEPGRGHVVVSPENSRRLLEAFIAKAKHQLLIYDPKVGDPAIVRLLRARVKAGVEVRIIGTVSARASDLSHEAYPGKRLHVRTVIRDGREAFVGSQSLRRLELDKRREAGMLVTHPAIVRELASTFEEDWSLTASGREKARARDFPPRSPRVRRRASQLHLPGTSKDE
jgi:cardiolipin synthase